MDGWMYICMYVYIHVCMYVCMYICMSPTHRVTVSAGVPTVWLGLLNYVKVSGPSPPYLPTYLPTYLHTYQSINGRFSTMTRTCVGGAACPPSMLKEFVEDYDVAVGR